MQAITTRVIPCTSTRPTRLRAECERGSLTISADDTGMLFPYRDTLEGAVFRLTRFIKHNRGLLLQAERPFVAGIIREWMAEAVQRYQDGEVDADDVWELIRAGWVRAAYPLGIDPVSEAAQLAKDNNAFPAAPPDYGPTHALIFRCLYWLNVFALKRQQPSWFASTYTIADRLNTRQTIVHRAVKRMLREKHITLAESGNIHRANRYMTHLVAES